MPGSQCAVVIGTQLPTQKKLLVTGREDMLQVNSPAGSLNAGGRIVGFVELTLPLCYSLLVW